MNIFLSSLIRNNYIELNNLNIVCDGSSLTAGGYGGLSYPTQLAALIGNGVIMTNKGVGGQQTSQMIADASTDIDVLISNNKTNVLCVWEVGNDIYYNGDVNAAITRITNYCQARVTAGWYVVLLGMTDRIQSTSFGDNSTQYKTKLLQANTILKNTYQNIGADVFVDLYSDVRLQNANNSLYFSNDLVHLIGNGNAIVASMIFEQIKLIIKR